MWQGILAAGAVAAVTGLHWWRGNAFLSNLAGTTFYVLASNAVIT